MAKAGYQVFVIGIQSQKNSFKGIEILPLRPSDNRFCRMLLRPLKVFYLSIKTGAKIFHFHDPELIPAGLALKLLGKKVIYDAHENYPQLIMVKDWIPSFFKPIFSRTISFLEIFASKYFDFTVAPSEPLSRRLPKGIALHNFPTSEILNLLQTHSKPFHERDIDLIHVGVLRKTRLDFFLEIIREIRNKMNVKVAFIGLSKAQIEYCKIICGNDNNTLLLERQPFTNVAELLGRSKMGLNYHPLEPHLEYAIPVKLFEYIGAGCVTITSVFPYFQAIAGSCSPVIFVSHNPTKFATIILELINDHQKMEQISKASRDFSSKFLWDTECIKLINAYRKLQ